MRTSRVLAPVAACLLLGSAACPGPQAPPPPEPAPGQPPAPAATTIDSVDAVPADGVLRIGQRTNIPDLDPILISDTTSDGVASKIFDTLLAYDRDLNLVPRLVEAMPEISPDGLVYSFRLKKGVKFHDGSVLVAADVAHALSRLATTRSKRFNLVEPIAGAAEAARAARAGGKPSISGIEVEDDHRFRIRLVTPNVTFQYHLAMVCTAPVPRAVADAKGDRFSREPVGTGPFRLARWAEADYIKLEPFADYHLGAPKLKGILTRIIPEPLPRQEEYRAGNLELIDVVSGMYDRWRHSDHARDVVEWPQLGVQYFGFNLASEGSPYAGRADEKARKLRMAVNLAVDREHICRNVLEDRYVPANGIIPKGMPGHDASRPPFAHDPARVKQILAEIGHPDGAGLPPVELYFNNQGDYPRIVEAVQADLTAVGIPVTLKALDWAAHLSAMDSGEPPFFRAGWVADYPDPENFLAPLFHSKNRGPQGNVTFYSNPEVDRLLDESYLETDQSRRFALLRQAEELVLADWPWLVLFFQKEVVLLKPYVKGFTPTAMDDDVNTSHIDWHLVELASAPAG